MAELDSEGLYVAPRPAGGHATGGALGGQGHRRIAEEHGDLVVVAEPAGRDAGGRVERVAAGIAMAWLAEHPHMQVTAPPPGPR
ncbi:hypothetical protein ACFY36_51145 [Actinoplanes sp. NPDC000266]